MTSDHRVAGSSPAGCRSSTRADPQAITAPEKQRAEKLVVSLLSGFAIFLDLLPAYVRITARILLAEIQSGFTIAGLIPADW